MAFCAIVVDPTGRVATDHVLLRNDSGKAPTCTKCLWLHNGNYTDMNWMVVSWREHRARAAKGEFSPMHDVLGFGVHDFSDGGATVSR